MKYMLCTDGSMSSDRAAKYLATILRQGDSLVIFSASVFQFCRRPNSAKNMVQSTQRNFFNDLNEVVTIETFFSPNVRDVRAAIVDVSRQRNIDCIVLGSKGHGSMNRMIRDSTTTYVVQNAGPKTVIVVNSPPFSGGRGGGTGVGGPSRKRWMVCVDGTLLNSNELTDDTKSRNPDSPCRSALLRTLEMVTAGDNIVLYAAVEEPKRYTELGDAVVFNKKFQEEFDSRVQRADAALQVARDITESHGVHPEYIYTRREMCLDTKSGILSFAKSCLVTTLILGSRAETSNIRRLMFGSLAMSLVREGLDFAVMIVPLSQQQHTTASSK